MATPLSAKNAKVRCNGAVITAKEWNVEPATDALDVSNFEGAGYTDYIASLLDADITITFDWDSALPQFTTMPAGTVVTNLLLYTNDIGSSKWTFASALVTKAPFKANVRESLQGSVSLKNKGTFGFA